MSKKPVHITTHPDGWQVIRENAERASKVTETKQQAVDAGRQIAKNNQTEFVIHRKDGTIQDKDSYGNDPNPPKDTKH